MVKRTILFIAVCGLLFLTQAAQAGWYDASWSYRRAITVTGSTAGVQTNYAAKVSVTYDSDMQADFDDVRFTDSNGTTLIDYWLETKTDSTSATFWVEVPSIPASPSTTDIYIYYGNASVSTTSSGVNTFSLFDDFEDGTLDATKWGGTASETGGELVLGSAQRVYSLSNFSDGAARFYAKLTHSAAADSATGGFYHWTTDNCSNFEMIWTTSHIARCRKSYVKTDVSVTDKHGVYATYEVLWKNNTKSTFYIDNALEATIETNVPSISSPLQFKTQTGASANVGWALVRSYVDPEPTVGSPGEEESSDTSSFFLLFD